MESRESNARARHAHRVTQSNGSTVDVHLVRVDTEFVGGRQANCGECFVDFEDVESLDIETGL